MNKADPEKKKDDTASSAGNIQFGDVSGGNISVGSSKTVVNTSGGAYVGGNVNVGGGTFVGRDNYSSTGLSGEDIAKLFTVIYQRIDAKADLPSRDKDDLKADVKDVEAETAKVAQGQKPDESFLERRLRSIKRMAPDILEVVAATFASPTLGAAAVIRKVIDRVKQEAA
jgi:hypothetical protein